MRLHSLSGRPNLPLACPRGMKWRDTPLYIQWTHLQDATAYTGKNWRHELDDEIKEFWDAVGAIFPDTAYASFVGFRDDAPGAPGARDMNWTYPLFDEHPLRTPYRERNADALIDLLDEFEYPPSYDLYNMSFKVLTQATTTHRYNMFGWNNPDIPELSDPDNVVRLVTLHTAAPGKVIDEYCPNDNYWEDCPKIKKYAKWTEYYTPRDKYNIPTKAEAYAQMDPNIIVQCVITTRGEGWYDVNWSQDWWRSVGCAIYKSGHPKFGDIQCEGKGMFENAKKEIIKKGCIPKVAVSEVAAPKKFDFEKHFAEQEKRGLMSLDCPYGTHRKDTFLVQWLHLQEATANSKSKATWAKNEMVDFFDGVGNIYKNSAFNLMLGFRDDPMEENDPELLSWKRGWTPWKDIKDPVWEVLDDGDFVSNYDGFEGGWKAMVMGSTHIMYNRECAAITRNEDDILRVVTMQTQAPGKVAFDDGQHFEDYCHKNFGEAEWKNCVDTNNNSNWGVYPNRAIYNIPTVKQATDMFQMPTSTVYTVLVAPGNNGYYRDSRAWWNSLGCRMNMRGYNFNVTTDKTQLFEAARKEFVRRSCAPN